MNKIIALSLLLLSFPAAAVICKTIDAEGNVAYSDVPEAECQNRVKLPDYSRYAPRPIERQPQTGQTSSRNVQAEVYSEIKVVQPGPASTVRSNEGEVPVSVAMTPPLQDGHRMRVLLDGVQIQPDFASQALVLRGVDRGTHTLDVRIVDSSGKELATAPPTRFTLRQASLLDPNRRLPDSDNSQQDNTDNTTQTDPASFDADNSTGTPFTSSQPGSRANHQSFTPNYAPR